MGYDNRDYHRENYGGGSGFARFGNWLLMGQAPLFRAFGIDVRAHSSLIIVMVLTLLFLGNGYTWQDRVIAASLLFVIVLLHEFGHCFGARYVGGDADEIVMHPLGGLALTRPPSNWRAHLITTLAGPGVNVAICILCGIGLYLLRGQVPWKPFYLSPWEPFRGWLEPAWLLFWIYQTSWTLLLFNMLPIYPLDGGRVVQEVLWSRVGYYRSMVIAANTGIVGAVVGGMIALATGMLGLLILAIFGVMMCLQMKRLLQEMGPYGFGEYDDPFAAAMEQSRRQQRKANPGPTWAEKRRAKRAEAERQAAIAAEAEIDRILAKVSTQGMHSLSRSEQRALREATERQNREAASRKPKTSPHR